MFMGSPEAEKNGFGLTTRMVLLQGKVKLQNGLTQRRLKQ